MSDAATAGRAVPRLLVALDGAGADAAATVARATAGGADGMLVRPGALGAALGAVRLPATAVVPDMAQLLRDAGDRGAPRAALDRLRRGGPAAFFRLALTGLAHVGAAARQDFRGIIPLLLELECASLGSCRLGAVVLAAPLTDLLLAAEHRDCVAHLVRFVHRRFGVAAGFETSNVGHLLPRLAAWGVSADFVIGPVNPSGHRMKPSAAAVLAAVREFPTPVVATDVTLGGMTGAEAVTWAREQGAAGVVLRPADLA